MDKFADNQALQFSVSEQTIFLGISPAFVTKARQPWKIAEVC
jgi:hypothetical protein